ALARGDLLHGRQYPGRGRRPALCSHRAVLRPRFAVQPADRSGLLDGPGLLPADHGRRIGGARGRDRSKERRPGQRPDWPHTLAWARAHHGGHHLFRRVGPRAGFCPRRGRLDFPRLTVLRPDEPCRRNHHDGGSHTLLRTRLRCRARAAVSAAGPLDHGSLTMDLLQSLALGLGTALSPENFALCFAGALLGTLIGVLPGLGPTATVAMLLPLTYYL